MKPNYRSILMKKEDGITLIELIIVVSIIGILAIALGFEFSDWMGKYKVESEVKDLYSDLMNARINALHKNRFYFVLLAPKQYAVSEDMNENESPDVGERLPSFPKDLNHAITWNGGGGNQITFNKRGLILPPGRTICTFTSVNPDFDCLVISETRISRGKLKDQMGACDATNCEAK